MIWLAIGIPLLIVALIWWGLSAAMGDAEKRNSDYDEPSKNDKQ